MTDEMKTLGICPFAKDTRAKCDVDKNPCSICAAYEAYAAANWARRQLDSLKRVDSLASSFASCTEEQASDDNQPYPESESDFSDSYFEG